MNAWTGRIAIVLSVAIAVWLIGSPSTPLLSQSLGSPAVDPTRASGEDLQVVSTLLSTGIQQIVVVQPSSKTLAVYHIDPVQGKLQLKSVRNLVWDLRMEHFNGQPPLPSELRQVEP